LSETPEVTAAANPAPEKAFSRSYQPTDEVGAPIGKRTVLGPFETADELLDAMEQANIAAVRGYHKLKNTVPTIVKPDTGWTPRKLTADEESAAGFKLLDPTHAREGLRTLVDAEFGLTELQAELKAGREARAASNRQAVAYQWMSAHPDFYNCNANGKVLADYLNSNQLEWTPDNLDTAFEMTAPQLAEKPAGEAPQAAANPPQRKPQGSPDIQPGQFTGTGQPNKKGLTKADYLRMGTKDPAEFERHRTNPRLRAAMEKVLGS
jgi:hypothetical protein